MKDKNIVPVKKMTIRDLSVIIAIAACSLVFSIFMSAFIPVLAADKQPKLIYITTAPD